MIDLINDIVLSEIKKLELKEKMTGILVKRDKRGTLQALQECTKIEDAIVEDIKDYTKNWIINELNNGSIRKIITTEVKNQVVLSVAQKGFSEIIKTISFKK